MDVDICNSCGHVLRQRLRFCTCCGVRIGTLLPAMVPNLGSAYEGTPASIGEPALAISQKQQAVSGRFRSSSLAIDGRLFKSAADLSCDQCDSHRPGASTPATFFMPVTGRPPSNEDQPTIRFFEDNGAPDQRSTPAPQAIPSSKEHATRSDTSDRPRSRTAFSGNHDQVAANRLHDLDDLKERIETVLKQLDLPAMADSAAKTALQIKDSLGTTKLMLIGVAAVLLLIFSTVSANAPKPLPPSQLPNLQGDWTFRVVDFNNCRTYMATALIKKEGNEFYGIGKEAGLRYEIEGNYVYPRVRFVKRFLDAANLPGITFEGLVELPSQSTFNSKPINCLHLSGNWWYDGDLVSTVGQHWDAVPGDCASRIYAGDAARTDNVNVRGGPQTHERNCIQKLILPPTNGSPTDWAAYFLRVAGTLIAAGLGLIFLSCRMFGPSGMLNIWAKKEYIPSQFKSQHYKVLRQYGQPLTTGGLPLGERVDWSWLKFWLPRQLAIPARVRAQNPHILVVGSGSKGKSRLLASMIVQDITANDRAVMVVDSDGSLADLIINWISAQPHADELSRRVITIDPVRSDNNLTYNPLEFPADGNLQNAASALVFGFKAIYTEPPGSQTQWNQQTADILRNAAILLMINGKTLTDLPVLLTENDFRDMLLERVQARVEERPEYGALIEAWARYKRMARTDQWINWIEPILNRINPMLGDPRIRRILTDVKGTLDLKEVLKQGKILLVKVPQGQFDASANLLGSLLVTGLKQAALAISSSTARPSQCALYLDEFDNFIDKDTFDSISSENRKFGIAFTGAAKTLQGLPEDYRNQLIINVGTLCCFALGKKDGDLLGPQMFRVDGRKIKHQTLQNIFNKVNTTPQFELITDEEKLNIDRVVGQEERTYFCYQIGTIAGVFQVRAPEFNDIPQSQVDWPLDESMHRGSV